MKVSISRSIIEKYPNISELMIFVRDINVSTSKSQDILKNLRKAEEKVREKYTKESFINSDLYKRWVDFYRSVLADVDDKKGDLKSIMPAHISLIMRVLEGKELPNINPLVNFYNTISIEYEIPIGVEDLDNYYDNAELTLSDGGEEFWAIGDKKAQIVNKNEIVWRDGVGVTCRMWNWRQSDRTKVTNKSRNVIFYIDEIGSSNDVLSQYQQLQSVIANLINKYFEIGVESYILNSGEPECEINYKVKSKDDYKKHVAEDKSLYVIGEKGTKGIRGRKPVNLNLKYKEEFLTNLEKQLAENLHLEENLFNLAYPPNKDFGDISSTAPFALAKINKCSPKEAGEKLINEIKESDLKGLFDEITLASNNFINFKLNQKYLIKSFLDYYKMGGKYGKIDIANNEKFLIESPSWNPNKTPHVGHALNLFIGKALIRLFEQVGYEVENDNIANDKGLPVMQALWAYMKYGEGKTPNETNEKSDHYVHRFYKTGKKEYEESENVKDEVKELLREWESGEPEIVTIWKKLVDWAINGQIETIENLGEEMGYIWYESDVYKGGKDIVLSYLGKSKYIEKLSDGAVIGRIEQEYGLPDTILIKSDGTGLYHTQDIYLTIKKKEKFNADRFVWVVGEEQIAHFQRLFAIFDALKISSIDNVYHYPYSHVVDKEGKKLSSRDGDDLSVDELLDMMQKKSREYLNTSKSKYSEGEIENISKQVAIGALKYSFLSKDPFKKLKFDLEEALSYQGKSGPYIMYTYTRANGILEKIQEEINIDFEASIEDLEKINLPGEVKTLILEIIKYSGVIVASANNYNPAGIADYLYDLAKVFSNFYESVKVTEMTGENLSITLKALNLFKHTIKSGLKILGINVLEKM